MEHVKWNKLMNLYCFKAKCMHSSLISRSKRKTNGGSIFMHVLSIEFLWLYVLYKWSCLNESDFHLMFHSSPILYLRKTPGTKSTLFFSTFRSNRMTLHIFVWPLTENFGPWKFWAKSLNNVERFERGIRPQHHRLLARGSTVPGMNCWVILLCAI
jgi:hypothetical protein